MPHYTTETELRRFAVDVFRAMGMPDEDAGIAAGVLVWADLRAVSSHGVSRLPQYVKWAADSILNPRPAMRSERLSAGLLKVDADRASGAVAMERAISDLVPMVQEAGIGAAVIGRMTHSGALGYYTCKIAEQGFACIAINAGIPLIPYHGTRVASLGTNPISIAVPGRPSPVVFDMATSVVALGRLVQARKSGKPLEPGWAIDEDGAQTTDPEKAAMVLPLGGAKGSGLSLMIECLASLLACSPLLADSLEGTGEGRKHRQNAMLIAIDVARFLPVDEYESQVARLIGMLRMQPRARDMTEILVPGERGDRSMRDSRACGIEIQDRVRTELADVARQLSVPPLTTNEGRHRSTGGERRKTREQ